MKKIILLVTFVLSSSLYFSQNASEIELSTENFSKGIYHLTLQTKNANNYSFKISKL